VRVPGGCWDQQRPGGSNVARLMCVCLAYLASRNFLTMAVCSFQSLNDRLHCCVMWCRADVDRQNFYVCTEVACA
jgi:hypothetical protein